MKKYNDIEIQSGAHNKCYNIACLSKSKISKLPKRLLSSLNAISPVFL